MVKISRREFLVTTASALSILAFTQDTERAFARQAKKSNVVKVQSLKWRNEAGKVDSGIVTQMINSGMMKLTSKSTPESAWKSLFSPSETICLKFNQISKDYTGANQALVDAITWGLMTAGVKRKNIIIMEAYGVKFEGGEPLKGWSKEYDFGSGKTRLSNLFVNQLDAVINIPNPKHHPICDFTGALKNISHANDSIMEGPERFHGNNCDPYIADINAIDVVKKKLRLHICNGLKGIFDRGAYPSPNNQWDENCLFISFDPVALDTICANEVDKARIERKLSPLQRHKYIATASERNLGTNDPDLIDLISLDI